MTELEFESLASAIKATYPSSKILADKPAMKFWYEMLKDIDYLVVRNAFQEFASTSIFPPTIADIRKMCAERCYPPIPSFDEAWGTVQKAITCYGSDNPQMAFETMNDITLAVVKNLGWKNLCQEKTEAAARANFREAYEAKAKELMNIVLMPKFVELEKKLLVEQHAPRVETKKIPRIVQKETIKDARDDITTEQWSKRDESLERLRRMLSGQTE